MPMAYSLKFQKMADDARASVDEVLPQHVNELLGNGAIALDIRDKEEHDADHIKNSVHISRGKLEMNIEETIPDLNTTILCYCNGFNRSALSAASLRAMGYRNTKFIAGDLKESRALNE